MTTTPTPLTAQDVVDAANAVGISKDGLTTGFGLLKAIVDAGFTDPGPFIQVLQATKLQNDKWKLQTQAATLQASQQQQINDLITSTNPPIGDLNQQIAAIDTQLKQLQGLG